VLHSSWQSVVCEEGYVDEKLVDYRRLVEKLKRKDRFERAEMLMKK
jgi:hypothetical protein